MDHPLIRKLQTLTRLPDEDRTLVESLVGDVRQIAPRHDVISEGERPDHVRLIMSGWSCRYKILSDGKRQITALLLPGDFCDAHVTLLRRMDHGIATFNATEVAFISRAGMAELVARPAIARALWWASLVDEGVLRAWIVSLGRRDAFQRAAHLVCELHARLHNVGQIMAEGFDCPLKQEDLGDALGLTPVHVNRVLRRLREEKLVTFRRGAILIHDLPRLQREAGFDDNYLHLQG